MRCARLIIVVGMSMGAGAFAVTATANPDSYYTYADVVEVEPLIARYTVTEPRETCSLAAHPPAEPADGRYRRYRPEDHDHANSHSSGAATLFGGVLGGLLGSQFGGGSGRKVLAIAGAMVGASIASNASRHRHGSYDSRHSRYTPQRCVSVVESREVEEVSGYRVHYLYQGQEFVKRVDTDPGDRVRVQVQVAPVVDAVAW
jgi:uncharacterized protein YcfJ